MSTPLRIMCLSNMYPGPDDPDYGAFIATMCDALEARGNRVDRVVIDRRAGGRLRTPVKYLSLLVRALRHARRADVVYAHYLFPTGMIACITGTVFRRPWVVTAHGRDVRNLDSGPILRLSRPGVARARGVIAVSHFLAGDLVAALGLTREIDVINMGVDTERFRPTDRGAARRALGLPEDIHLILAVGGLTERKNPLRLLAAAESLMHDHPGLRLAFVGQGPLRDSLQRAIDQRGLSDRVILTGAVDNAAVASWMAACDVLALPSTVEPLGVVALEALASGRPVVATRVGGTGEVIGSAGVLVDPTDVEGIARGLAHVLGTPPAEESCVREAARNSVSVQAGHVERVLRRAASVSGDHNA